MASAGFILPVGPGATAPLASPLIWPCLEGIIPLTQIVWESYVFPFSHKSKSTTQV